MILQVVARRWFALGLAFIACLSVLGAVGQSASADDQSTTTLTTILSPAVQPVPTALPTCLAPDRAFVEKSAAEKDEAAIQNAIYGTGANCSPNPRSYATLNQYYNYSFPDFLFFLFSRNNDAFAGGSPPSYVPQCSTTGVSAPETLASQISSLSPEKPLDANQIRQNALIVQREFDDLLMRLRVCDYYVSVYAWNTRNMKNTQAFTYSWHNGCNSFDNEKRKKITLSLGVTTVITSPTRENLLALLSSAYYDYDDLYGRVASCQAVVANLAYKPNTSRFFCNYGSFVGALITAYSAALGHKWGPTGNATQAEITAFGTVMIASPALCPK